MCTGGWVEGMGELGREGWEENQESSPTHTYNRLLLSHEKEWNNTICKTWMDLEIIILSEVHQKEKDKYLHVESKIWHKWTCLQNRNRLTDREQTGGCQWGERAGEGQPGTLGLADANQHTWSGEITIWYCTAENYSQYPAINHNGKEEKHLFWIPDSLFIK